MTYQNIGSENNTLHGSDEPHVVVVPWDVEDEGFELEILSENNRVVKCNAAHRVCLIGNSENCDATADSMGV